MIYKLALHLTNFSIAKSMSKANYKINSTESEFAFIISIIIKHFVVKLKIFNLIFELIIIAWGVKINLFAFNLKQ